MAEIKFSPDALHDLKEIKAYITDELCSPSSAAKTVGQIMNRIRQRSEFPALGAPLSSVIHMEVSYRFLVCGHYTAFYKVDDGQVHIIRILYNRRNFMQILFGKDSP